MDFRQPAFFLFLKAVFVFPGRCGGRRSRRDSFLSFQSLLADATFPSGKVIRSVTHLVPAWHARPGCQSGLPSFRWRGSAAHALLPDLREPENIQCQTVFIQCVMTCGSRPLPGPRPTSRGLTAWSNHHKFFRLGPLPPRRGSVGGETRRVHSVLLARGSRPLGWLTTGLP